MTDKLTEAAQVVKRLEPFVHGLGKSILKELKDALAQQDAQAVPTINYALLYEFSNANGVSYNSLCKVVWDALNATALQPVQQDAQAVPQEPCAVVKWQTGGPVVHIIGEVRVGDLLYRSAPTPPAQQREPDYTICPTCGGMASDPIVPQEQISDGEFDADKRLMELADKIDHEQNWRLSGIDQRDRLTQEQQDRVTAGVMLRRYADLMAPDSWRLFPPKHLSGGLHCFRAATLEKAVEMASRHIRLNAAPAPSAPPPEARQWTGLTDIGVYFAITAAGKPPNPMSEEFFTWCEKFADAIEANLKERNA